MAYVPNLRNDIFISYSHIDNQSVQGSVGWVTDFQRRLQIEVEEQLGARITIWRDARIGSGEDFSRDIERQLRSSALLLPILSPGYAGSVWCEREARGFVGGTLRIGDLWIDTKCRVIKIAKRPAAMTLLPETGCIDFFEQDPDSSHTYEREPGSERFNRLLADVAHEIVAVLRAMRKATSVFLGTASPAMAKQREGLKRELEARDYRVVTSPARSPDSDDIERAVNECSLSIVFDGGRDPSTQAGSDTAANQERAVAEGGARVIVVARRQPNEVTPLPVEKETPAQVEWLVNPATHALNHTVLQMLNTPAASRSGQLVRIYLICDRQDHPLLQSNHARALRDYLLQLGYEVKTPLAEEGDAAEFSRDNRGKLRECDAVVLYWGASRQGWFDQRLRELMQARGWRRGREFKTVGAFVSAPGNPIKENYETKEVDELIKQFGSFDHSDARLTRLVERLALPV